MRYALFARLFGLGVAVGLGLFIATLGDPFAFVEADLAGVVLRSLASALHEIRLVVIDLVSAFVRIYL